MKPILLTTALLSCTGFYALSQSKVSNQRIPWEFYKHENNDFLLDSVIKKHQIITYSAYKINDEKEKALMSKTIVNPNSKHFHQQTDLNKRKPKFKSFQEINNYQVFEWKNYGKVKKRINKTKVYGDKQLVIESFDYKKNKLESVVKNFYQENGLLDSSLHYLGKHKKLHSKNIYSYSDNGELIESRSYIKGKLNFINNHNCNPLGEPIKKVSQSKTCISTEFDKDGNMIKIYVLSNANGTIYKIKTTFKDTSNNVIKSELFDSGNRITSSTIYDENTSINQFFNKRGKVIFKTKKWFNKNKQLIKKEHYKKSKLAYTKTYSYNKKGLRTKYELKDSKGNTDLTYYEYEFLD